jgi:hypothetical protein
MASNIPPLNPKNPPPPKSSDDEKSFADLDPNVLKQNIKADTKATFVFDRARRTLSQAISTKANNITTAAKKFFEKKPAQQMTSKPKASSQTEDFVHVSLDELGQLTITEEPTETEDFVRVPSLDELSKPTITEEPTEAELNARKEFGLEGPAKYIKPDQKASKLPKQAITLKFAKNVEVVIQTSTMRNQNDQVGDVLITPVALEDGKLKPTDFFIGQRSAEQYLKKEQEEVLDQYNAAKKTNDESSYVVIKVSDEYKNLHNISEHIILVPMESTKTATPAAAAQTKQTTDILGTAIKDSLESAEKAGAKTIDMTQFYDPFEGSKSNPKKAKDLVRTMLLAFKNYSDSRAGKSSLKINILVEPSPGIFFGPLGSYLDVLGLARDREGFLKRDP